MKKKVRIAWIFVFCICLMLASIPVFAWGDSTPDSPTEGFSDDANAMDDFGFYTGDYDASDFPDTGMDDHLEAYYSALAAYTQAVQAGKSEAEIAALAAQLHTAQEEVIMYADCHQDQYSVSYSFEGGKGSGVTITDNKSGDVLMKAGDPVLLSSGVFILDEKDVEVNCYGTTFALNRYLSSEEWKESWETGGVFGNKWASVLDSRIIRCSIPDWQSFLKKLNSDLVWKRGILEEMAQDVSAETDEVLPDMRKLYQTDYDTYIENYNNCLKSIENSVLSKRARFGYSGELAGRTGTDSLIYVDEKGTPVVFEKSAEYENLYECVYGKLKKKLSIQVGEELVEIQKPQNEDNLIYVDTEPLVDFTIEYGGAVFDDDEWDDEVAWVDDVGWTDEIELIDEELLALEIPYCETEEEMHAVLAEKERNKDVFYLTDQFGNKKVFDDEGFIQEIRYASGGEISFNRDENENVVSAEVNGGRTVKFEYENERLVKVTDGSLQVKYGYDEKGMLVSFTDKDGDEKKFVYDNSLNLLKFVKADSTFSKFEYKLFDDGKLRTVATVNENGDRESFDYDTRKMKTVYSDYDGIKTQVFYDTNGKTTKEIHPDGLEKNYVWNEETDLAEFDSLGEITRYEYDDDRNVTGIIYSDGTSENWTYENFRIKSYRDKKGIVYSYGYDSNGNCTEFYRNGWLIKKSVFNKNGSLKSVQDEYGSVTEFFYDGNGNLKSTRKTDKTDKILEKYEFEYDDCGRAVRISDLNGKVTEVVYGNHFVKSKSNDGFENEIYYSSRKDTVKQVQRDTWTGVTVIHDYKWDNCHNLLEAYTNGICTESNVYSAAGRLVKKTVPFDEDRDIVYEYQWKNGEISSMSRYFADKSGNKTGQAEKTDFSSEWKNGGRFSSVTRGNTITSYFYNSLDKLVTKSVNGIVVEDNEYLQGKVSSRSVDGMGRLIFNYDNRGYFTGSYEETGSLKSDFYEMSDTGLLLSYTDRSGLRSVFEYDGNGQTSRVSSVKGTVENSFENGLFTGKKIISPEGKTIQKERREYSDKGRTVKFVSGENYSHVMKFDIWGNVISYTDGEGNVWKMKYDCFNNCVSKTDPYGNETKFIYNFDGSLKSVIDCDGTVTSYEYDLDSNCISVKNPAGVVFKGEYDENGRLIAKEEMPFSGKEFYEYDEMNRIVKVKKGNRLILENKYTDDGKIIRIDAKGNKTISKTDGYSRIVDITDRLGAVKEFSYNSDGTTSFITDYAKDVSSYSYSSDGLTLTVKYSDGTFVKEQRDMAGNIIRVENETGWETFTYDTGGKLLKQYDSFTGKELEFSYDKRALVTEVTGDERKVSFVYGKAGELKKVIEDDDFGGVKNHLEVEFEYDSNGRKISQAYSSGEKQKFFYDEASRLILTAGYDSDGKVVFVEGNVYDEKGHRVLVLNKDFTVTRYKYDEDGCLSLTQYPYSQKNADYLMGLCADAGIHNLGYMSPVKRAGFNAEEYGKLSKLCSLISHGQYHVVTNFNVLEESYKYDLNGNMTVRTTPFGIINYSYDSENRLLKWGACGKASYDANGNMTRRTDMVSDSMFEYTKRNRIAKANVTDLVNQKTNEVNFGYDALGRRNFKSSFDGAFKSVFNGIGFEEFLTIQTGDSLHPVLQDNAETGYRYSWGEFKASVETNDSENENYAALYAGSTTPVALICFGSNTGNELVYSNMAGTAGDCQNFDAFGAPLGDECRFGFGGKKYDAETKTYNFGYRDYDCVSGRFTTVDPIYDGFNWYSYCNNDPVNYTDPLGLRFQDVGEREMQDYPGIYVGNSSDSKETMELVGCLVTAFSELISCFTGTNFTAEDINNIKGAFVKDSADMNIIAMGAAFGLTIEIIQSPFWTETKTGYVSNNLIKSVENIKEAFTEMAMSIYEQTRDLSAGYWYDVLSEYDESKDIYSIIAQVIYDSNHTHFVNLTGNVTVIDGKGYVPIAGTSKFDKSNNLATNRTNVGWIIHNGRVYVPTRNITKVITCEKQ